ncbi:MAG: [FeFe] hydrogenase H-cluster maturation GTPase HydF [Bacteroidales bacterium]|nr:[FeFe] hydrogenase H-cluster maturation GTPase HydF [Clostridium sp.]MCM1203357.1 [FeFe] hydrogenase H-cluster maturation GTPase HydF [Bacteroidales bacterium]
MGMNQTPMGNRVHIGFFGRRNAGKSSLVNAVTGQELAVVSEVKGTTTDPVYKAMELLPLGPVVIIDTPGIDDEGSLGELRMRKTRQVLNKTDIAVLVADGAEEITGVEEEMLALFREKEVPYLVVENKADLVKGRGDKKPEEEKAPGGADRLAVSALTGEGIEELKEKLAHKIKAEDDRSGFVGDLLHPMDVAVLVVPLDSAAPKGRLILPQQQAVRDILEAGAVSVVVRDTELRQTLERLSKMPDMVITDSQVFKQVAEVTPETVPLTSFSILMARKKGFLKTAVGGVLTLDALQDGDKILIAEGCTHHRQCEDIGTVKLPGWIRKYTGKEPEFVFCSGVEFPEDLSPYRLVVHCGGCMLNEREMRFRMKSAVEQGIPFTNYGISIAYMNGILKRSVEMLPEAAGLL